MKLLLDAVASTAKAKELKALANLNVYMTSPVGIGEHPDVVEECAKLVSEISEARDTMQTIQELFNESGDLDESDEG